MNLGNMQIFPNYESSDLCKAEQVKRRTFSGAARARKSGLERRSEIIPGRGIAGQSLKPFRCGCLLPVGQLGVGKRGSLSLSSLDGSAG